MTEEEIKQRFKVAYPDFMYNDLPLSPYFDIYCYAIELMESELTEKDKQIEELKEKLERAERARDYWKDSSFDWRRKCTSRRPFRVAVEAQKRLTKAKGIIQELLSSCFGYNSKTVNYEVKTKAEQFLKEVEE